MTNEAKTMKALVYEGPRTMQMRQVPVPDTGEDEVLISVEKVGICGSELGGYLGHNSLRKPPLIMGHEFAGLVKNTGAAVSRISPGARVTANPLVTCGSCPFCRSGETQLCPDRKLLGAHLPGAFAEFVAVAQRNVYELAPHVSMEEGAFAEPFACAVHVCRLLELKPEQRLVIYGAGPIGLFTLQAAQVFGARDIVIVDLNEARLEIARELGGIAVTRLEDCVSLPEGGFDAAVDAVGAQVTRQASVNALRSGGRVIFTGLHEADSQLPINDIIRREIVMRGAFAYSHHDFETALDWIAEGKVNLLPWTVSEPLEEGGACFEKLISGPGKTAKILLTLN